MSNMVDHIAYLSQTIGPRPAGTEEEQQAAFYIAEQFQQEADLPASIEDFNGTGGSNGARIACSAVTLLVTVLSLFLSALALPALVVTIAAALLFVAEVMGKPVLSKLFRRGVSQNVVARFEPEYSAELGGTRRRKIVLVAHYDSGKVQPHLNGPLLASQGLLKKLSLGGMVAVPVVLLVKNLFFLHAEGALAVVLTVLVAVALVLSSLPLIGGIVSKVSAYNEAANCNASGVAVLLDAAARIAQGSSSLRQPDFDDFKPMVHGEEAARDAGLVPEGAQLVYEAPRTDDVAFDDQSPEARLAAAKAAVAALTGRPVSTTVATGAYERAERVDDYAASELSFEGDFSQSEWVESDGEAAEMPFEAQQGEERLGDDLVEAAVSEEDDVVVDAVEVSGDVEGFSNVPDWFRKAQAKARKTDDEAPSAYRSRYADALDAALSESDAHFANANRAVELTVEQRLQQVRESIMEVKAPEARRAELESALTPKEADAQQPEPSQQASESASQPAAPARAARNLFIPSLVLQQQDAVDGATQSMPPIDVSALKQEILSEKASAIEVEPASAEESSAPSRRLAGLPSFDAAFAQPLAEQDAASHPANNILSALPSINGGSQEKKESRASGSELVLPSLSGALFARADASASADDTLASGMPKQGAALTGTTMAFAPVMEELIENADPEDLYVYDADDSGYDAGYGDAGSFASPDYVEMPKSRLQRFFGRFGRKKKEPEISTQEWLDVDEDFDARSVGAERGSWESFRNDDDDADGASAARGRGRRWNGGMYAGFDGLGGYDDSFNQVERFYRSDINTEVWFVALGAELSGNNGMKAFLAEHAQDLRGAVIVELEALGAGELCLVESEGSYLPVKASSRMKRYAKKAASETGVSLGSVDLPWHDSATSCALKQGQQAMHIVGSDGLKPALFAQKDDVLENIDEEALLISSDFVMELVKSI